MTKVKRLGSIFLVIAMLFTAFATLVACKQPIDNETTRLVLSTSELDGVFNPFFSSSATDSNMVGMTQLAMLSVDKDGGVAVGNNEACVVLEYEEKTTGTKEAGDQKTTYKFVLKNNVKFSNGSPLTMKDVLFNLYVYLDPSYTGSSTIYSTDIVGLAAYRTQTEDASQQDKFEETFQKYAWDRIDRLSEALEEACDAQPGGVATDAQIQKYLKEEIVDYYKGLADAELDELQKEYYENYTTVLDDYSRALKLFREELETDYTNSIGTAEDIKFDEDKVHLNTDTEAFLYNEGFITWNDGKNGQTKGLTYLLGNESKNWSKETAIQKVYEAYVAQQNAGSYGYGMWTVINVWGTASKLESDFTALAKKAYFDTLEGEGIPNISGITFANRNGSVTVNGTTYAQPQYNDDGSVKEGNEVLQIVINDVDPKAIWNFGFSVAPMYYYSTTNYKNKNYINAFDYESNFGVEFGDPDFMTEVVKNSSKIGVPVGAGPYKATTRTGDSSKVNSGTFLDNNVVYFERNEHFVLGPAKIKYVNYQVVSDKQKLESLKNGDIHFAEPQARQEIINEIKSNGLSYSTVKTNGYGYIGINAEKVPDLEVRQAIMHAINTQECVDYYAGYSTNIYRALPTNSWAYPKNAESQRGVANEQYYYYDESGVESENLVKSAGYVKNLSTGIYEKKVGNETRKLEFTFTIAGDSTDHPAYSAMMNAAEILNARGFKITVQKDINALKKLNTGDLAVWAAAWSSTIDPDMYQVYHIDSQAGSTSNWGYRAIKKNANNKYYRELGIVEDLSDLIDKARQTTVQATRTALYAEALKLVMELAVELPTYQRSDLFAYNAKIIDASTLTPERDLTPYNGPLNRLWEVSLNETK